MDESTPLLSPELFAFLCDLRQHNERAWFEANRQRYEDHVRRPLLAFIEAFAAPLHRLSPHFRAEARGSGGSLFRIHRDTRFAADKSPYKTNAGVQFRHACGRDAHAPGYYLHLAPDEVFVAAGVWHPEPAVANQIREAIVERSDEWQAILSAPDFAAAGFYLDGSSYQRVPPGYDRDHPLAVDLRRRDFVAVADLSEAEVCRADFLVLFGRRCAAVTPFMRFVTQALGQPF